MFDFNDKTRIFTDAVLIKKLFLMKFYDFYLMI